MPNPPRLPPNLDDTTLLRELHAFVHRGLVDPKLRAEVPGVSFREAARLLRHPNAGAIIAREAARYREAPVDEVPSESEIRRINVRVTFPPPRVVRAPNGKKHLYITAHHSLQEWCDEYGFTVLPSPDPHQVVIEVPATHPNVFAIDTDLPTPLDVLHIASQAARGGRARRFAGDHLSWSYRPTASPPFKLMRHGVLFEADPGKQEVRHFPTIIDYAGGVLTPRPRSGVPLDANTWTPTHPAFAGTAMQVEFNERDGVNTVHAVLIDEINGTPRRARWRYEVARDRYVHGEEPPLLVVDELIRRGYSRQFGLTAARRAAIARADHASQPFRPAAAPTAAPTEARRLPIAPARLLTGPTVREDPPKLLWDVFTAHLLQHKLVQGPVRIGEWHVHFTDNGRTLVFASGPRIARIPIEGTLIGEPDAADLDTILKLFSSTISETEALSKRAARVGVRIPYRKKPKED